MKKTILLVSVLASGLTVDVAKADFVFGTPANLGPNVNTASGEGGSGGLSISADGLSIYFDSNRSGGYGSNDLWVARRATKDDDWRAAVNLGSVVNSSSRDVSPSISADGLSLYFSSTRPGGAGGMDLWVVKRQTTADHWGAPSNIGPVVNGSDRDYMSHVSADGLSLYLSSTRAGGFGSRDLWVSTRATKDDEWGVPVNLGATVNTAYNERRLWISSNALTLLFQSDRPRGTGYVEIWMTTRAATNENWAEPVKLGPEVNATSDISPIVSSDGRTLYFSSYNREGGYGVWDLWQAPIIPHVDLNGDGIVDSADVCIVVNHWGTDNPLCDMGPMPWGDGVVDVKDLIAMAEYIGQETYDPTLIGHWALDETEGFIAQDSAGGNDGMAMGLAAWQPDGGKIGGALEFTGANFVTADSPLSPADPCFSILVWVKGGAPGQVIVSQSGVDWLMADPVDGKLMTQCNSSGPLCSHAVITDGAWHRVAFAADGSHRILCVDDEEVARDAEPAPEGAAGRLMIGTGKAFSPGTYWTGLIDDVRIYKRAVTP